MYLRPILAWSGLNATFDIAQLVVYVSRILLFVVGVELLTMPVTQDLWAWDRFLHGGSDFELGLLLIVSCLCLMLLQAEQCKDALGLLLAMRADAPSRSIPDLLQDLRSGREPISPLSGQCPPCNSVHAPLLI